MSSTKMYDQFNDFFFDIIVANDKWSWSIYFEFTYASSLVPKNWVCCGDYLQEKGKPYIQTFYFDFRTTYAKAAGKGYQKTE